jgi:hypothetical protein
MENNDSMSFQNLEALRDKIKSFWSRKEGKLAMLILAIPTVLLIINANKVLAFLILLFQNIIIGTVLGVVAAIVLSVVLGCIILPGPRNAIIMTFKGLMSRITRAFTKNFAIEIVEDFKNWVGKMIVELENSILALKSNIDNLKAKMKANSAKATDYYEKAEAEEKIDKESEMIGTYSSMAEEWESYNKDLGPMVLQFEELMAYAKEYKKLADIKFRKLENKVTILRDRKETMGTAVVLFRQLRDVILGDPAKDALYKESVGFLNTEYNNGLSEIEHFLDTSQPVRHEMKLESIIQSQRGLDSFNQWKQKKATVRPGSVKEEVTSSRKPITTSDNRSSFFDRN